MASQAGECSDQSILPLLTHFVFLSQTLFLKENTWLTDPVFFSAESFYDFMGIDLMNIISSTCVSSILFWYKIKFTCHCLQNTKLNVSAMLSHEGPNCGLSPHSSAVVAEYGH